MRQNSKQTDIYLQRLNIVINHIRENSTEDLSLSELAQVAGFSPFHVHRLFKSLTNETVSDMATRFRLERAASLLRASPGLSVTDAAFECGFRFVSVFSRTFKKHYGINAREWDRQSALKNSKNGKVSDGFPRYTLEKLSEFAEQGRFEVHLRSLPAQRLAYIRVFDSYSRFGRIKEAYHRLITWYCQHGGDLEKTTLYGMSQDDPEVTPLRFCRFDWCLSVPYDWHAEAEVSVQDFPACRVATIRCLGDLRQEYEAVQFLFRYWLPLSRYQPANLPGMEIYRRHPVELGWEAFDLDCAIPIVAL